VRQILTLLGFAKKANKLVTGSNAVLRSVLYGESYLVIVNEDAGKSVKDKFRRICSENEVKFYVLGDSKEFSKATGEENKVIYSVTEEGFAKKISTIVAEKKDFNGGAVIE